MQTLDTQTAGEAQATPPSTHPEASVLHRTHRPNWRSTLGLAAFAAGLLLPGLAHAATITVSSDLDAAPAVDGACTLREAILNANADNQSGSVDCVAGSGADTIVFDSSMQIDLGAVLELSDLDGVVLEGGGAIVDGASTVQLFKVTAGAATFRNVVFSNARAERGAAIQASAAVTAEGCIFTNNVATGKVGASPSIGASSGMGGAIFTTASLTLTGSTFADNRAEGVGPSTATTEVLGGAGGGIGGAVCVAGTGSVLTVTRSHFKDNVAKGGSAQQSTPGVPGGAGAGLGGAIALLDGAGSSTIAGSMFRLNTAIGGKGGASSGTFVEATVGGDGANGTDFRGGNSKDDAQGGAGAFGGGGGGGSPAGAGGYGAGGGAGEENPSATGGLGGFAAGGGAGGSAVFSGDGAALGGAIFTAANLVVTDSTFANNAANVDRRTSSGQQTFAGGRGAAVFTKGGAVSFARSAIASNTAITADAVTGQDACGTDGGGMTSAGNNLVFASPGCPTVVTDLTSDPLFFELPDTLPFPGAVRPASCASPLLSLAGDACAATDLLGTSRPRGANCDAGAVELAETDLTFAATQKTPARAGQNVDVEVAVLSTQAASNVVAEITLTDLTYVSGPGNCSLVVDKVQCSVASLTAGGDAKATLVLAVSASPSAAPSLTIARLSSDTPDCTVANDSATLNLAKCGDGVLQANAGEKCDDGGAVGGCVDSCLDCEAGFAGSSCDIACPSTANGICNGEGTCDDGPEGEGTCKCDEALPGFVAGYFGASCSQLCPGFDPQAGDPAATICSSHGLCATNGTCQCADGYYGADCGDTCPGGAGPGQCGNTVDNGNVTVERGLCDDGSSGTGDCVCGDGWYVAGSVAAGTNNSEGGDSEGPGVCTDTVCGDGLTRGTEGCDDNNFATDDACPSGASGTCQPATCGDGFVRQVGVPQDSVQYEQCDNGASNSNTTPNACRTNCRVAHCGDGVVDTGEQCDLGASNSNTGACTLTCQNARCGDGFVRTGVEGCDDGDNNNHDNCPDGDGGTCQPARCGDGYVNVEGSETTPREGCDDLTPGLLGQTVQANDGCSLTCLPEAGYTCNGLVDTTCTAGCGVEQTFATSRFNWQPIAGSTTPMEYGGTRLGSIGWESGLTGTLPAAPVFTGLQDVFTVPPSSEMKTPELEVRYALDVASGGTECLKIYVTETPSLQGAPPVASACADALTATSLFVDLTTLHNQVRWVSIVLDAPGSSAGREGLALTHVRLVSDADGDGVREFRSHATCDTCVDEDTDTFGHLTSRSPLSCAGGTTLDCDDNDAAIRPNQTESCTNSRDDDCDAKVDAADELCFEDCGDGVDNGGNGLVDCADGFCNGKAAGATGVDPYCAVPCLRNWTFDGQSDAFTRVDMDANTAGVQNFWTHSAGQWSTTGLQKGQGSTRQFGKLQITVPLGRQLSGPRPKLFFDFDHDGPAIGIDRFAVCIDKPNCQANDADIIVLQDTPTTGQVTREVDLTPHVAKTSITLTLLFDTFETAAYPVDANGVTLYAVRLGSDADSDGQYEGRIPFYPSAATCDPCWDVDGDFYGDADSPTLTQCLAFGPDAQNPRSDCDDTRFSVTPANPNETSCGDGLNNDCDFDQNGQPLIDALDSDCGSEDCANGVDDNEDGNTDCSDPTCNNSYACNQCFIGFDFTKGTKKIQNDATSTGASGGWTATVPGTQGRLWTWTGTEPFGGEIGWETGFEPAYDGSPAQDLDVSQAGTGRVRGWLARRVTVPSQMSVPEIAISYRMQGDGTKDTLGVCFNVATTACSTTQPANVRWSTTSNTNGFQLVRVPIPVGQVDVVIFFDTQDGQDNNVKGAFIGNVQVISDIDRDTFGEYFGRSCDACVDWDKDGYGDTSYAVTDLTACDNPDLIDCDDRDASATPGRATELCYTDGLTPIVDCDLPENHQLADCLKNQDCDAFESDSEDPDCIECGNGHIETGETCDDGNTANDDGCDNTCQVESGLLYLSEMHLPILFNSTAEQWIELYNGSQSTINLEALNLVIKRTRNGVATGTARLGQDCVVQTDFNIEPGTYYVIAFGSLASSDFLEQSKIDATCGGLSFDQTGLDGVDVFQGGVNGELVDGVNPNSFACARANSRFALGVGQTVSRSLMLRGTSNPTSNNSASAWCLAGPQAVYSATGAHLGTPGAGPSCAELLCDGVDDDCDGGTDETTELADADADTICNERDCVPSSALCNFTVAAAACTADFDGDGTIDCQDTCQDVDGDGYGFDGPAATTNDRCEGTEDATCDDNLLEYPGNPEGPPDASLASCANGIDEDCDGARDCLDTSCRDIATCESETCASATPVACGDVITFTPLSDDFPSCASAPGERDRVFVFESATAGGVTFRIQNLGTRLYQARILDECRDKGFAIDCSGLSAEACTTLTNTKLCSEIEVASAEASSCLAGGAFALEALADTPYYVVFDQVGTCANGGTAGARLTVACDEVCDGAGIDEDADGATDCDDDDCVADVDCAREDFDLDGVDNGTELLCSAATGANPLVPLESPSDDAFVDPDNDTIINCVDPNDDNDAATDAVELTDCTLNPTAKNDPAIFPGAPVECDRVLIDADCNERYDTTEAECGVREANCGNNTDDDEDGNVDCADVDCIGSDFCRCADFDRDGFDNLTELQCNTSATDATKFPDPPELAADIENPGTNVTTCDNDNIGDGIPNCSDPDDDNDGFPDTEELVCGSNPLVRSDVPLNTDRNFPGGDTQCDAVDTDDDADGFLDLLEIQCLSDSKSAAETPVDAVRDQDGDEVCNALDTDDDGDSWLDFSETDCGTDPLDPQDNPTVRGEDPDDDRLCDLVDVDDDNDTWRDLDEIACGTDPRDGSDFPADKDGDLQCDAVDGDDDGDGVADGTEILCGTDPLDSTAFPAAIDAQDTDKDDIANCVDTDDDGDGVSDVNERAYGTDPLKKDTDEDGLEDGVENADKDGVRDEGETDALRKQSDSDGVPDGVEATSCYFETSESCKPSDPTRPDTDGDGRSDGVEDVNGNGRTDPGETSPVLADTDGDLVDDGEEKACGSDALDPEVVPQDKDENGICDGKQVDTDKDGTSDGVEDWCGTDKFDPGSVPSLGDLDDTDGDGDINCVDADDDQDDASDADELECGLDPRDSSETPTADDVGNYDQDGQLNCSDPDDDNDDLSDVAEATAATDPKDADSDDDGLSDGREVNVIGTDPSAFDTDEDGLGDGLEFGVQQGTADTEGELQIDMDAKTTTDPKNRDTDGDGVRDGEEDANGNGRVDDGEGDPLDPTDGLRDTDGDGLIDREETLVYNTAFDDPDTDDDGLDDKTEVNITLTDPLDADSDDGGVIDGNEDRNGTDPNDPNDDFSTTVIRGDDVFSCSGGQGMALVLGLAMAALVLMRARRRRDAR